MSATTWSKMENLQASTLDGAILAGDLTLDVQAGDAAGYGAVEYELTLGETVQGFEIVRGTGVAGDTITITRAQGGTAALPFDDATPVRMTVTKLYVTEVQDAINNIEDGTTRLTSVTGDVDSDLVIGADLDLILRCDLDGDGANKIAFHNGADTEVGSIDESGNLQADGSITSGISDSAKGTLVAYGSTTGTGGEWQIYNSADVDINTDEWHMFADGAGDLQFRASGGTLGIDILFQISGSTRDIVWNNSGNDRNFTVQGATDAQLLFLDAGADAVTLATAGGLTTTGGDLLVSGQHIDFANTTNPRFVIENLTVAEAMGITQGSDRTILFVASENTVGLEIAAATSANIKADLFTRTALVTIDVDGDTLFAKDITVTGNIIVGTAAANDGRISFGNDSNVFIHNETADTRLDVVAAGGVVTSGDFTSGGSITMGGVLFKTTAASLIDMEFEESLVIAADEAGGGAETILFELNEDPELTIATNLVTVDGDFVVGGATAIPFSAGAKAGMSSIGGHLIKLTNTTGAVTIAGQVVMADTTTDNAVVLGLADDEESIGIFLESGIADDAEAWVVVSGIADVAMQDNTSATHGFWVRTSITEAGYADATNASPPGGGIANLDIHMKEIGHCIETVTATGGGTHILARCVLHFN